jgi:predicted transcriptional regulator
VRAWKEDTWQEGRKKPAICTHIGDMRKFQNKFVFEDREEILQYIQSHPGCSTFDVELECHQTRTVVNIRARELIEAGRVERQNGKYFFGSYK